MPPKNPGIKREFLQQIMEGRKVIYTYILSMVRNKDDAEDIIQDVVLTMWDKYDSFKPGTNFTAWGIQIAKFKIMNFFKAKKNDKCFDEDVLENISDQYSRKASEIDHRLDALEVCIEKLSDKEKELVKTHYMKGIKFTELVEVYNKPAYYFYRMMAKVHDQLMRCVNLTVRTWESYE